MTTTFETAKVGDRVWCIRSGWGTIIDRFRSRAEYPLVVEFDNREQKTYTLWGLLHYKDLNPTLFWDEVKFEIPEKPLPQLEVDTKVLVWVSPVEKLKRHFSHFENGLIAVYEQGRTSFTTCDGRNVTCWPNWELAE